jgi:hypothetical protein
MFFKVFYWATYDDLQGAVQVKFTFGVGLAHPPRRSSSSESELLSPTRGATCLALASLNLAVPLRQGLLCWSLFGEVRVAPECGMMTMTPVCNLDDDLRLGGVCAASVGCQGDGVCAFRRLCSMTVSMGVCTGF